MSDNEQNNRGTGQQADTPGYHTPGQDTTLRSTSEAVPTPSETSEQRLDDPKPYIEAINATPGEANPARGETVAAEQGGESTADLLIARETSEERPVREEGIRPYQDQSAGTRPEQFRNADSGRPTWPDDKQEEPIEYMEAPRPYVPLGTLGGTDFNDLNYRARIDAEVDRSSTEAEKNESRSGLPQVGLDAEEDKYEQREFGRPTPPSEMEMFAPGMPNLPPTEEDEDR
ncbi:MAG: hypothetical protein M3328_08490 [Chloroflexota bacterium]|nr:hypothetical protein [Chloroflexota bacterium]